MLYTVSPVQSGHLKAIQALENELGKTLIAFSAIPAVADEALSPSALTKLEALEKELGVMLVAVAT